MGSSVTDTQVILEAIRAIRRAIHLVENGGRYALVPHEGPSVSAVAARTAYAPACRLEDLGDPTFCADHRIRYPYLAGAMANGIGSAEIVEAMGKAGMLAFFGAAGLPLPTVEAAIDRIQKNLGDTPYGFNLIHSPSEPSLERGGVELYLRRGVRLVEASAFLDLTLPVVRYRTHGIRRDPSGKIVTPNRVIVKVSRVEVASKFLAPPPERMLQELIRQGHLTPEQAALAARIPVAQDVTAEADSGGHTDNRPAITLVPTLLALRDRLQAQYGFEQPLRVGAAGGIATPASAAAAFAMGAAYVLTGSVNQACVESGSSDRRPRDARPGRAGRHDHGSRRRYVRDGRQSAGPQARHHVRHAPPSSTSFIAPTPAWRRCPTPSGPSSRRTCSAAHSKRFGRRRAPSSSSAIPSQVPRAESDAKHKMALVFRWYLGLSSRWANAGEPSRRLDYQVWCGPAMGAFNEWAKGSFLEQPRNRRVVTVAFNILYGAAVLLRLQTLRSQGFPLCPTGHG